MRKLASLALLLSIFSVAQGQDFSNKGKEFWLAYSYHVGMNSGGAPVMTLYITSDVNCSYTIEAYGSPSTTLQTGNITAGQVITYDVPTTYFINNEGAFNNRAIHVVASKPVVVYSYITRNAASGATVCLPVNVLGKEYYSMNFEQVSNENLSNSYFTIIATKDNTVVEITPSANTKAGWTAGNTYTVNLGKGDIYQVLGTTSGFTGSDLTGSKIKSIGSCNKIAVFSGSGKIRIPASGCNSNSSDNLYQQLYPTVTWGQNYLTVPSYNRPNNYYRIIRYSPTANVYLNGNLIPAGSFTGNYYQFFNNIPNSITSDTLISVAQYFTTQNCDGNNGAYDPDMIVLNPVEQNIKKVTLVSSNLVATTNRSHHIQAILKNGGSSLDSFRLDGNLMGAAGWTVHPQNSAYSYRYFDNVNQGYHTISSDSGFNGLAYGFADFESYGYSAGANVVDRYQFCTVGNTLGDPNITFAAACKNSPFCLNVTLPYRPLKIEWYFYGLFPDVVDNNPVAVDSFFIDGRKVWRFQAGCNYSVANAGVYPITVTTTIPPIDGCTGEQDIDFDITVFDPPVADFSWTHTGCITDTVYFKENSINTGGRPVYKWRWLFHDNTKDSVESPKKLYSAAGNFDVKLQIVTDVGCVSDTLTKPIQITTVPIAAYNMSTPRCPGVPITVTTTSSVNVGTLQKWVYSWGDASPNDTLLTNAPIQHTYTAAGPYTFTHTVITNSGCKQLVTTPITINVKPVPDFTFPANICLPQGAALFTNTTTISDGTLPQMSYVWNFGDGSGPLASPPNPVSPLHNFAGAGPYTTQLIATSNNGCIDSISKIVNTIRPQPISGYNNNAEVCLSDSLQFSSTSNGNGGSITGYFWDFGDATTSILANPKKRWATPGTKIVKHWIVTDQGCNSDTTTKTIYVNQLPTANFTFPNTNRCARVPITFNSSTSTPNDGNLDQWTWDFGDGSGVQVLNNGNPIDHIYNTEGTFDVKLTVRTDKGCISTTTLKQIVITATPVASFIPPGGICLPAGNASFTNNTSISDGTLASVTYVWDFGDGSGPLNSPPAPISPTHIYSGTGPYPVKLVAKSAIGCTDDTTQQLVNIFAQPKANFTSNPEVCLSDSLQFTDNSNPVNGTLQQYFWDFGDGNTSNLANPKHKWATPGSKTVKHWIITSNTCMSDTMTKSIFVNQLPTASFTVSATLCPQSPITFTSTSVPNSGILQEFTWDFGDASPVQVVFTGAPINHTYAAPGPYTVKLTVKTDKGCVSTVFSLPITVNVLPVPNFTPPANVCLPEGTALFTNTTTISDGTLPGVTYTWNFGDATPILSSPPAPVSPTHNYSAVGPFTVKLVATSNKGCKDSVSKVLSNIWPQPKADFNNAPEVCLSDSLQFTDNSNGNGGTITEHYWDFGDATTSSLPNPKKKWATAGSKTVKHWIKTDKGCLSDTLTKSIFVNRLPTADFTLSNPQCIGRGILFTSTSVPNDGIINKWNWDMGDGTLLTNGSPFTHAYIPVGTYTVTLKVETDKGCVSNPLASKPVVVTDTPMVNFSLPEICLDDPNAQFFDSSKIADGTEALFTYKWKFGDPNATPPNPDSSALKNPTHRYTAAANYNMRLEVTSNKGCKSHKDTVFTVNGSTPVANFTIQNPANLCSNKDVVIQNTSTVNFGNVTKIEVYWDWTNNPGLKTTDDVPTPGKLYNFDYPDFGVPATKTYTIRMLAYSGGVCVNAVQKTVTVLASPTVVFGPVPEICLEVPSVQLIQASETSGVPGTGVFSGNGVSTGGSFNPSVAGVGSHIIRYTFTATNGCNTFKEQTVVVNPTPNITAGPDRTVLEGGSAVLLASSTTAGVTYLWAPATWLSATTIAQPTSSPLDDITYTITATTIKGCKASDQVFVKVLKSPQVPNVFTPNGDRINDTWEIPFLNTYIGCTVEVYNRYGQNVYRNTGYDRPWDGTFGGKPLPMGTYYYIIEPKNGRKPITGYVDIVR
jgi:gliding motility-associated-like protein